MDGVQLPQGYSHFEKAVYFLPFSSKKFLQYTKILQNSLNSFSIFLHSTNVGWGAKRCLWKKMINVSNKFC